MIKKSNKIVLTENVFKKTGPVVIISIILTLICSGIEVYTKYRFSSAFSYIIGLPFMVSLIAMMMLGGALSSMKMDQIAEGPKPPSHTEQFWMRICLVGFFNIIPGFFVVGKLFPLIGVTKMYESGSIIEYVAKFAVAIFFGFIYNKIVKAIIKLFFTM